MILYTYSISTHLYEGQQRADHKGDAVCDERWQLVAQGLASSAGHEAEHILALHAGVDHLQLQGPAGQQAGSCIRGSGIQGGWLGGSNGSSSRCHGAETAACSLRRVSDAGVDAG